MELVQSTSFHFPVLLVSSADHITGATGAVLTIAISKNGGSFVAIAPAVTEVGLGVYSLALTPEHTDTIGSLTIQVDAPGCDPFTSLDQVISGAQALIPSIPPSSLLDTLKGAVGIALDDPTQDVFLTELIILGATVVEGITKHYFGAPREKTEYQDGNGQRSMILEGYIDDSPAANVNPDPALNPSTSLIVSRRSQWSTPADWEALEEGTDFERRHRTLRSLGSWSTWSCADEFRFMYLDGFIDAPADIKRVIVEIATNQYLNDSASSSGTSGITAEKIGDYSYQIDSSIAAGGGLDLLSDFSIKTLKRYRRELV